VLLEKINEFNNEVGKPKRKRAHIKSRYSWEDNIKIGLKETGLERVDWIDTT
jgi:hypothetical protein